jgi:hypothetical protein
MRQSYSQPKAVFLASLQFKIIRRNILQQMPWMLEIHSI